MRSRSVWKLQRRRAVCGGRLPLPPQHLMETAAVLFMAAMVVSLVIVAGGLEPVVVKVTEYGPQLGSPCQDSPHWAVTSHEENIKSYNVWRQCVAVLCDVWRSTGRGRSHSPLKSQPSLPFICFQLPTYHDVLHRISLSIRLLLFMLLVVAGDVERNPGPPKSKVSRGGEWSNVSDHKLTEDDAYDVYEEVFNMAGSWGSMAVGLRLPPRIKSVIAQQHSNNPKECLLAVVEEWLKGLHNIQKYGHPSWCTLVQAVADPMGGANPALAHSIAAKHSVTSVPGEESDGGIVQTPHQAHTTGGYDIDPELHDLSTEFSRMLDTVAGLLEVGTDVDTLKWFIQSYFHPLYPEKQYIEPHVYRDAKTVRDVLLSLFPWYINYMHHLFLDNLIDHFGNEECRHHLQKYEHMFQIEE